MKTQNQINVIEVQDLMEMLNRMTPTQKIGVRIKESENLKQLEKDAQQLGKLADIDDEASLEELQKRMAEIQSLAEIINGSVENLTCKEGRIFFVDKTSHLNDGYQAAEVLIDVIQ